MCQLPLTINLHICRIREPDMCQKVMTFQSGKRCLTNCPWPLENIGDSLGGAYVNIADSLGGAYVNIGDGMGGAYVTNSSDLNTPFLG